MKPELLSACDQLANAALNGVAEGMLLIALVAIGLRVFGPANAATRHVVYCGAMLLLVALVPAQLWRDRLDSKLGGAPQREQPKLKLLSDTSPDSGGPATESQVSGDSQANGDLTPTLDGSSLQNEEPLGLSQDRFAPRQVASRPARITRVRSWALDFRGVLPPLTGLLLVVVWIAVAGMRLIITVRRLYNLRRLKLGSLPATGELNDLFQTVRTKLHVSRKVELRTSPVQRSAVVLGFFHPVILFPIAEEKLTDLQAAEQVFSHELAHIIRFDDWTNLIQRVIQVPLFFHPAVWWISNRLALEREIACDDFVLQRGGRPRSYALLLVSLAGRESDGPPMLAPGVSTGKGQLRQRINMILNPHRNRSPRLAKAKLGIITATATLVALLVLYAGPRLVLAQNANQASTIDGSAKSALHTSDNGASSGEGPSISAPTVAEAIPLAPPDPTPPSIPSEVAPGPKFKSATSPGDDEPPRAPRAPRPPAPPRIPHLPDGAGSGASIEERLDRIEAMVRALATQQNARRGRTDTTQTQLDEMNEASNRRELDASIIDAKREAERRAELDKRAGKQAEKAAKLEGRRLEKGAFQEGYQKQLDALHQQRDILQREMEKLQRLIERIEREHERMDEQKLRHAAEEDEKDNEGGPKRP